MKPIRHTPENTLGLIIDPLHGPIQLEDEITGSTDLIQRLLKTRMLTRLRSIKQLGFASYYFPAADHTRLAHALGTMQVMRRLIAKQLAFDGSVELIATVKEAFPDDFNRYSNPSDLINAIATHVYIAGLLQDVGELPFAQVTDVYFRPTAEAKGKLAKIIGHRTAFGLETKEFFTLACIHDALSRDEFLSGNLSFPFLAYLTTGAWKPETPPPPCFSPLAHMLDGVVDADRIDYVARDGLHTLGSRFVPSTIMEDLRHYTEKGPVFSESEPVIAFLTAYAQLWSSVYFAPENRFRVCALASVFQEIKHMDIGALRTAKADGLANKLAGGLSLDEFMRLDDRQVFNEIQELDDSHMAHTNPRLASALSVLLEKKDCPEYDALWVSPPAAFSADSPVDFHKLLGGMMFFDAFFQTGSHTLYSKARKPVLIHSHLLDANKRELFLHELEGPFKSLFQEEEWRFSKKPGSVLVFFPSGADSRKAVVKQSENAQFYVSATQRDPLRSDCYADTTVFPNHHGPAVFISYESEDLECVHSVCSALYKIRRKYYFLRVESCVGGISPQNQSIAYAKKAEIALILLSKTYLEKFQQGEQDQDGNIWHEVTVLKQRVSKGDVIVKFLTPDGFECIKDFGAFPLPELAGHSPDSFKPTQIPSMSTALRGMTAQDLANVVNQILVGR
jgi:HD superfamily phosphohydrolase